jgi:pilus assembly protein Flp/PilA
MRFHDGSLTLVAPWYDQSHSSSRGNPSGGKGLGESLGRKPGDLVEGTPLFIAISAYVTTAAFVVQKRLGNAAKGATAVEYGLLVALIAAVIIAAVTLFGTTLAAIFTNIKTKITPA